MTNNGYGASFWGDESVSDPELMVAQHWDDYLPFFTRPPWNILLARELHKQREVNRDRKAGPGAHPGRRETGCAEARSGPEATPVSQGTSREFAESRGQPWVWGPGPGAREATPALHTGPLSAGVRQ